MAPSCFVPQTSIQTDGYRSLREGEDVEFDIETGGDSRTKAINVTGPNGAPPQVSIRSASCRLASTRLVCITFSQHTSGSLKQGAFYDVYLRMSISLRCGSDGPYWLLPCGALPRC